MSATEVPRAASPVDNSVELRLNSSACTTTWRGKIWNYAKQIAPTTLYNIHIYAPLAINVVTELGKKLTIHTAIANIPSRAYTLYIEVRNQKFREAALNIAALACLFLPKGRLIAISLDMVRLGLGSGSSLRVVKPQDSNLSSTTIAAEEPPELGKVAV